ncbi:MAG: VIT1/CCC1 transporter family protein [Promethearchaeota archaeon]
MSKISEPNFKTKKLERYKILWQISEASPIIRRYFAMNFFDGILTALGIVLAQFAFYLSGDPTTNKLLFFTSLITAMAIGISGLTGSHLAETAERRLNVIQMKQVLGLVDENGKITNESDVPKWSENDLNRALGNFESIRSTKLMPGLQYKHLGLSEEQARKLGIKIGETTQNEQEIYSKTSLKKLKERKKKKVKNEQTIYEEAQHFAGMVAALVDGLSPFAGVMIVVLPFMFGLNGDTQPTQFIISFILTVIVLFTLGGYLARLSKDSVIKYGSQMVAAAVFTSAITLILNQLVLN